MSPGAAVAKPMSYARLEDGNAPAIDGDGNSPNAVSRAINAVGSFGRVFFSDLTPLLSHARRQTLKVPFDRLWVFPAVGVMLI